MPGKAVISGVAVPFRYASVDTDAIYPVSAEDVALRHGYGAALFGRWREQEDFILDRPVYQDAKILVTGPDFGIGSSRETAVWALAGAGFSAVVAPSFGDIFRSNCTRNGVLAATATPETCEALLRRLEDEPGLEVSIDLGRSVAATADASLQVPLRIDEFSRRRLLEGLDEFDVLASHRGAIEATLRSIGGWLPNTKDVASLADHIPATRPERRRAT